MPPKKKQIPGLAHLIKLGLVNRPEEERPKVLAELRAADARGDWDGGAAAVSSAESSNGEIPAAFDPALVPSSTLRYPMLGAEIEAIEGFDGAAATGWW